MKSKKNATRNVRGVFKKSKYPNTSVRQNSVINEIDPRAQHWPIDRPTEHDHSVNEIVGMMTKCILLAQCNQHRKKERKQKGEREKKDRKRERERKKERDKRNCIAPSSNASIVNYNTPAKSVSKLPAPLDMRLNGCVPFFLFLCSVRRKESSERELNCEIM